MSDNRLKIKSSSKGKAELENGFIALVLTLSIGGILLALVSASSIESALFFDEALRKEYRTMNYYYATDCLDQAILDLAHDYFFTIESPIRIEKYHCSILSIQTIQSQSDIRIISAKGDFQKADVYRQATIRLHDHSLDVVQIE